MLISPTSQRLVELFGLESFYVKPYVKSANGKGNNGSAYHRKGETDRNKEPETTLDGIVDGSVAATAEIAPVNGSELNGTDSGLNHERKRYTWGYRLSQEARREIEAAHHTYDGYLKRAAKNLPYSPDTIRKFWVAANLQIRKRGRQKVRV